MDRERGRWKERVGYVLTLTNNTSPTLFGPHAGKSDIMKVYQAHLQQQRG